mmetsp:Transcript_31667/g.72475  ORF Transcript_31667/g.72475 Transcript_31667/m.72475 type:complete len:272 (-) Transcript_31667:186-1001(-)
MPGKTAQDLQLTVESASADNSPAVANLHGPVGIGRINLAEDNVSDVIAPGKLLRLYLIWTQNRRSVAHKFAQNLVLAPSSSHANHCPAVPNRDASFAVRRVSLAYYDVPDTVARGRLARHSRYGDTQGGIMHEVAQDPAFAGNCSRAQNSPLVANGHGPFTFGQGNFADNDVTNAETTSKLMFNLSWRDIHGIYVGKFTQNLALADRGRTNHGPSVSNGHEPAAGRDINLANHNIPVAVATCQLTLHLIYWNIHCRQQTKFAQHHIVWVDS